MTNYTDYYEPVDRSKLLFNDEYEVNDFITIHQPKIRDIVNYQDDEAGFYAMLHIFCGNTTHFRVQLWDMGIDWNKINDFELFSTMVKTVDIDHSRIIFGELDFQKFELATYESENENGEAKAELILYDSENEYVMTEKDYLHMRNYLRHMFNIFPKVETGVKGKIVKEAIIDYDKQVIAKAKRLGKNHDSTLYPLFSTLLTYLRCDREFVLNMGIVEFMDRIQRITVFEHSVALLHGMMGGFINAKEIKPEQYDFMKNIDMRPKDYREQLKETAKSNGLNDFDQINKTIERKGT